MFKCPYCGAELKSYVLAGVYMHLNMDLPDLERVPSVPMRWSGRFRALAMAECEDCGGIAFLRRERAEKLGMKRVEGEVFYPREERTEDEK